MADGVITERSGLWTRRGAPPVMAHQHRHDDVELNVVREGRLRYLFGGSRVDVNAGDIALFWGTTPHRLVRPGTAELSDVLWLHVPLVTVLSWELSPAQLGGLLQPRPVVVPAAALDYDAATAVDVVCDVVLNARIAAADVETERSVILDEIAMRDDDPDDSLAEAFAARLFAGHPVGDPVSGTAESVAALSRRQVHGYYRRRYDPRSMVIAVAGGVAHGRASEKHPAAGGEHSRGCARAAAE
ncbi:MAG: cupin domain-containing protein [Salana multivorans]|nr:cupin domain-containing protein [Salana multivorans]